MDYDEGSVGLGFLLGFILGLIGLIIACAIGKRRTIKGAGIGILADLTIGVIILITIVTAYYSQGGAAYW